MAFAQDAIIRDIVIHGQRRIPAATIRARMNVHAGDTYDQAALERDFHSLWNTGYFDDIRYEREEVANGWTIHVYLKEKPTIREIHYTGLSAIAVSDILEAYKTAKLSLSVESQYDPVKAKRAEVIIRQLLAMRGHQFSTVKIEVRQIPPSAVGLTFAVKEGPTVKVGDIRFKGNRVLGSRALRYSMKNLRPIGIPHSIFLENIFARTYDETKLSEDSERVRNAYQVRGYFKAIVQQPKTVTRDSKPPIIHVPLIQKRGKRVDITVPVEEGKRYTLKAINFSGNKTITNTSALRSTFPMKDGEVFNIDLLRKGLENIRNAYSELGFINATPVPDPVIDDEHQTVTLNIDIDEGKSYHVRRIEFAGNTTTRDKVIRRELAVEEGQVYNSRLWKLSLLRLNQLDYFEPLKAEGPDSELTSSIKKNDADATVDITLNVKEKGKNSIGMNGGVSGLSGSFIGLDYQTNNLMGLGLTLRVQADLGTRQRNFMFGITDPYIFDHRTSVGFTVFNTEYRFNQEQELSILYNQKVNLNQATAQNYSQKSKGFTLSANHPLRRSFTTVGVTYSYSITDIDAQTNAAQVLFQTLQYRNLSGPSALKGMRSSRITPSISYNTVDNPMNPSRGKSFYLAADLEGLGGNSRSITQIFETKYFRPVNNKRNVLGFRLQGSFTTGWGGMAVSPNNRFYTGGDDSIRGFEIRSVSPVAFVPISSNRSFSYYEPTQLDGTGSPSLKTITVPMLTYTIVYPGGDTQLVGNAEYRIPLAGPISMALFADAGVNGILRRNQLRLDAGGLSQLRSEFPNSNIGSSLQLLPGSNFAPRTSTGVEVVVQLPIVQAPFRVYWAYNPTLYSRTITAPASEYYLKDALRNSLPPGMYEEQIAPAISYYLGSPQEVRFREKRSTFRFTVSRTF